MQAGNGIYLARNVDEELLQLCHDRVFAYLLTARQMGKSSLMIRTAQRLAAEGTRTVIIDLSQMGVQVSDTAWHLGLLIAISRRLHLKTDVFAWWEAHAALSFTQRMTQFFQEILLSEIHDPIVIFIDEIDSTLSLPFTDDFFAAIRYVYNARSSVPAFKRLSFILIGVATPSDLISDPRRTPFNIGKQVDVAYFTLEEAMPLAAGLDYPAEKANQILRWVMNWTGGHPYLTQRLCHVLAEQQQSDLTQADINQAVARTFLGEESQHDSNLRFVHDMLTQRATDPLAVLLTYEHIVQKHRIPDEKQSAAITHLKLSGIIEAQHGYLTVSNRIYATVFDRRWVKKVWPEHWIKRVPPVVLGLVAALFAAVILLGLFLFQTEKTRQAQLNTALQATLNAQLSEQILVSDSLRRLTEAEMLTSDSLRRVELTVNTRLSDQIRVSDSLRQTTETTNAQLINQIRVVDSLRINEEAVNAQLTKQIQVADSLRTIAEARLDEATAARLETLTIALASKALRQLKLGDPALGALLARQAFQFSEAGAGEFLDPVYDALVQTLNALNDKSSGAGGSNILDHHNAGVRAVACSPDGRWLAAASEDGKIRLWSLRSSTMKRLDGHAGGVRSLAFSPDGTLLTSGGDDPPLLLWRNLDQLQPDYEPIGNHKSGVWTVAFSPTGRQIASAGADQIIAIWDLEQHAVKHMLGLPNVRIRAVAFRPHGELLAIGGEDGLLRFWNWDDPKGKPLAWDAGQGRLLSLAFSPDGDRLVTAGDSPEIRFWPVNQTDISPQAEQILQGHEGAINAVTFSPDGTLLASASSDQSIQVWHLDHLNSSPLILQDHTAWVWSVAFYPGSTQLVSGSADHTSRRWNIKPALLAEQVCSVVQGRELSTDEWAQYVGSDFVYSRYYEPCASHTTARSDQRLVRQPHEP